MERTAHPIPIASPDEAEAEPRNLPQVESQPMEGIQTARDDSADRIQEPPMTSEMQDLEATRTREAGLAQQNPGKRRKLNSGLPELPVNSGITPIGQPGNSEKLDETTMGQERIQEKPHETARGRTRRNRKPTRKLQENLGIWKQG